MPSPFTDRLRDLARDFRERKVLRAGLVYGTVAFSTLGVLDLVRDLISWLDRVFPVLVLSAVFAFPVVLVAAWVFEIGPRGIRLHHDPGRERASVGYRLGAGAVVGLASVLFGWTILTLWTYSEERTAGPEDGTAYDPTRIAVLYFDDHSPGGDLGYLANGLTEDLINALVRVPALEVTSRNGVKPFREVAVGTREIARQLRVGTLVEGSVTGDSNRVRATVQLIDARTDEHLLSEQFESDLGDVLRLQDELSSAIAVALRENLGVSIREEAERERTDSPEAWTSYHEAGRLSDEARELGREHRETLAVTLFRRADSLYAAAEGLDDDWPDPSIQRGWNAVSWSTAGSDRVGFIQAQDSGRLLALAEHAVDVSGASAPALELRGAVAFELAETVGGREDLRQQAEEDFLEAIGQDPKRVQSLAYLSAMRRQSGDFGEARHFAERALAADAFYEESGAVMYRLFEVNLELRDWNEADRWCTAGRREHPERTSFVLCRIFMLSLLPERADPAEAWALLDTLRQESSREDWEAQYRTWAGYQVARVLARNGLNDSTEAVLVQYRPSRPEDRPYAAYDEASVRLLLGDREGALDLLEEFLTVRPDRVSYLPNDWLFEELWDDPRFEQITGTN